MQAIVLAAGYGYRMRPLSDTCHKALLRIGDSTILGRLVTGLLALDVDRVTVVTGYRAEEVREYLTERFPARRLRFVHNARFAETNNVVSLGLALEALDALGALECDGSGDVVLTECDLLLDPAVFSLLIQPGIGNAALVDHYRIGMDGTVVSVVGDTVSQVFPPHRQGPDFSYVGLFKTLNVYRFTHQFCRRTLGPLVRWYAEEVDSGSYYELVLGMLTGLPAHDIAAIPVPPGSWIEVDDPNDLAAARFRFEPQRRAEILDRTLGGQWNFGLLDFSYLRNVYFPTEAMIAAMRHALPELLASYGSTQVVLNEKMAWFVGCVPSRLQVLHGAAQAFPLLAEILGAVSVALPVPTFGEYSRAFPHATTYADLPGTGVDVADLDRLAAACDLLVVVNPNNPTGTTHSTGWLHDFAARHSRTTFLVDESFLGFSGEPSLVDALEVAPLPNVAVLVSLSKTLGVPGLRVGYLYSQDAELLEEFGRRLPIWNTSALAEYFVELLLKFRPELAEALELTVKDRRQLRTDLLCVPGLVEVGPSGGNFLLARLIGDTHRAGRLRSALLEAEAIEIKDVTAKFPDGAPRLRIAVRGEQDNARLLAALHLHAPRTETGP
jgi:histidinol-phosphate/aromatic aminotransferase/cobyric acid decarboxylase-like protein/choline kinase